jgi:hypothetical protein
MTAKYKYPKRINLHKKLMDILNMRGWSEHMKAFAIKDLIQNSYRRRQK